MASFTQLDDDLRVAMAAEHPRLHLPSTGKKIPGLSIREWSESIDELSACSKPSSERAPFM